MRHSRIQSAAIGDMRAAVALFRPMMAGLASERLCVAHLGIGGRLLDLTYCPLGTDREVRVPMRGIIQDALTADARAMVIAHNHPNGDPNPSPADRRTTRRMVEVCRELGIELLDHLVFAGEAVISLREAGLL